jgi:hypothetical protein
MSTRSLPLKRASVTSLIPLAVAVALLVSAAPCSAQTRSAVNWEQRNYYARHWAGTLAEQKAVGESINLRAALEEAKSRPDWLGPDSAADVQAFLNKGGHELAKLNAAAESIDAYKFGGQTRDNLKAVLGVAGDVWGKGKVPTGAAKDAVDLSFAGLDYLLAPGAQRDAQVALHARVSSASALGYSAVYEALDLCARYPDSGFCKAFDAYYSAKVQVPLNATPEEIRRINPALRVDARVEDVLRKVEDLASENRLTSEQQNDLLALMIAMTRGLHEKADQVLAQQGPQRNDAALEAARRELEGHLETCRSVSYLTYAFASQLDPAAARRLYRLTEPAIDIYAAVRHFLSVKNANPVVLTANIVKGLFDLMGALRDEKPPEQLILEQLSEIRSDIRRLAIGLNQRLDHVDESLARVLRNLADLQAQGALIEQRVADAQSRLWEIQDRLPEMERSLSELIKTDIWVEYQQATRECLYRTDQFDPGIGVHNYRAYMDRFWNLSAAASLSALFSGTAGSASAGCTKSRTCSRSTALPRTSTS